MKKYFVLFVYLILTSQVSWAGTASGNLGVSAVVTSNCSIILINPLNFGSYTISSRNEATGDIRVLCTLGTAYRILVGAGTGLNATVTARSMKSGSNYLPYALYSDAAHTKNWGVTTGTDTVDVAAGDSNGLLAIYTVYGVLQTSVNVPAGAYIDTVPVTINF